MLLANKCQKKRIFLFCSACPLLAGIVLSKMALLCPESEGNWAYQTHFYPQESLLNHEIYEEER